MTAGRAAAAIVLLAVLAAPVAAQSKPAVSAADRSAALNELRAREQELEKLYKTCPTCNGKGKVSDVVCSECGGDKRVFTGRLDAELQGHLDNYVAYCEAIEKHAAVVDNEPSVRDRVHANRALYLEAVTARMGTRPQQSRRIGSQGQAEYRPAKDKTPPYTRLACDLLVARPTRAVGHGVAFDGTVVRVYRSETGALAEVKLDATGGEVRHCYVPIPPSAKWIEKSKVRIIGKIVDGAAQRQAFGVDAPHPVILPCYGTE